MLRFSYSLYVSNKFAIWKGVSLKWPFFKVLDVLLELIGSFNFGYIIGVGPFIKYATSELIYVLHANC
jgi:hypothetical protein